jgi:parallel beta-helix repeat protein
LDENNITNNSNGIYLESGSDNEFYHNNFINNTQQVGSDGSPNSWDDGYPSGGNYWSDYLGTDITEDAIGDIEYTIDANNTDYYPLMGPFKTIFTITEGNTDYVDFVSKSTITNLNFDPYALPYPTLSFDVAGADGITGFCRVAIPKDIMWCDNIAEWTVTVGGTLTQPNTVEDADYTYIYFAYTHSTKTVQITSTHAVPEFQPFIIAPMLMTAMLLAAIFSRTHLRRFKTRKKQ